MILAVFGCAAREKNRENNVGAPLQNVPITDSAMQKPNQEHTSEDAATNSSTQTRAPTNDFQTLLARAAAIQAFEYNLSDSAREDNPYFFILKRLAKVRFEKPLRLDDGTLYDEVFMDRPKKVALSHCSRATCDNPSDKRLEVVNYSLYYELDPLEQMYKAAKPVFVADEMFDDNEVKKFSMLYDNRYPGFMWVQSYYGFPMKFEYTLDDGSIRTIEYREIKIDNVRLGQVLPPFNFTVGKKNYFTFLHYLGIYPGQPNASSSMPV